MRYRKNKDKFGILIEISTHVQIWNFNFAKKWGYLADIRLLPEVKNVYSLYLFYFENKISITSNYIRYQYGKF